MAKAILYSPDDFEAGSVLVKESVYETIYRLEEAYWGLRKMSVAGAKRTLKWVKTRIVEGPEDIIKRTEYDRLKTGGYWDPRTKKRLHTIYLKSLTGEPGGKHPLMLLCTVLRYPKLVPELTATLKEHFMLREPGPKGRRKHMMEIGMYCCQVCTP